MSSSKASDNQDAINSSNWYQKMRAATKAHGVKWRKQFTPEELQFIENAMHSECTWVARANREGLPGPRRFGVIDD
ncbi:hypothetical protein [Taklimakanibacter lacteus]|uniref:hypothetical protein n=1 Tax=Taklimakanibacter lacteus TaxID=2268456 RepID=UPI0013C520F0